MSAPTQQELPSPGRQGAVGALFSGIGLRMLGTISERRKGETERARGDGSRWPRSLTSAGLAQERPGDEVLPLSLGPCPGHGRPDGTARPRLQPQVQGLPGSPLRGHLREKPRCGLAHSSDPRSGADGRPGRGSAFLAGQQRRPPVPPYRPAPPSCVPPSCGSPLLLRRPHDLRPTCCAPRPAPRPRWQPQKCPSPRQPPAPAGCSDQSSLEDRGRRAGPSLARFGTLGVFSCAFRRSSRAGRWSSVFLSGLSLSLSSSKTSCNCRFPGASEDLSSLMLFRRCFLSHTL